MGRSYWFECLKCGYRAKVSGRADRGLDFTVQTILCLDCHELYDAVTRMRIAAASPPKPQSGPASPLKRRPGNAVAFRREPPTFEAIVSRLPQAGVLRSTWQHYKLQCPVSATHRVRPWSDAHKCPKCGLHLEKNALPYRIWD